MKKIIVIAFVLFSTMAAEAKVQLPQMFQSGMVLQRGKPIPVWGKADAGESVSVTFRKKVYNTTADDQGQWMVTLPVQKAGGPYELKIKGGNDGDEAEKVISDVLIGDVWLCSGQSNIDVTVERVYPQYGAVIDDYENANIRLFRVQNDTDTHGPKTDIKPTAINWKPATKQNAWLFSAVGYFLGREMYEKTGVPQGIIVNSWGGTPIQAWLSADTLKAHFPDEYMRTLYFQDDEMVRSMQRANAMAQKQWNKVLDDNDHPGEEGWKEKDQYDNLTGERQYCGSFWARQQINVDASHAGQAARLLVGTLYDADYTYINGKQVGHTGYQYPPRRYQVPAGLLKEGSNTLSIRFITKGGNPHFIKEKPYKLIFEDNTEIPLSTKWQVHEGVRMPQCPQTDVSIQNLPTVLYNAVLCPLAPYALQGVVWYQGESNTGGDARHYEQWLTELVTGWRQLWNEPDMPFVVVQLANFMQPSDQPQDTGWSTVREAQRKVAATLDNTELACIIDLGETVDIHPLRKREVAQRIALGFDHIIWNKKSLLSPQIVKAETQGRQVTITLDQALSTDGQLYEFEVAGKDGRYHNAEATAKGNQIFIQSPFDDAQSVRYAWKNNPIRANVYGKSGLPMSPFTYSLSVPNK